MSRNGLGLGLPSIFGGSPLGGGVGDVWVPVGARGRGITGTTSAPAATDSFDGQNVFWAPSGYALTSLKVGYPNFEMAATGPIARAAGCVFLDFASGINYQMTSQGKFAWSSAPTTTIPAPVSASSFGVVMSDAKAVTIAANNAFGVRMYGRMAVATAYALAEYQGAANGATGTRFSPAPATPGASGIANFVEGLTRGTALTDTTDQTGAKSQTGTGYFPPSIILALIRNPTKSVLVMGDSIGQGQNGDYPDNLGNLGYVARSLRNDVFWSNLSRGTLQASFFNTAANRQCLDAHWIDSGLWASDYVNLMGRNDMASVSDAATIKADVDFMAAPHKALNRKCWIGTIVPWTSSTDNWVTTANQTLVSAPKNTIRVTYNTDRRTNYVAQGYRGVIDIALALETASNGGLWLCPVAPFTLVTPIIDGVQVGNITVSSTAGITALGLTSAQVLIDSERIQVTVVDATTLNIVTGGRAQASTTGAAHSAAAAMNVPLTNDGIHPNYNGHELARLAGVMAPSRFG